MNDHDTNRSGGSSNVVALVHKKPRDRKADPTPNKYHFPKALLAQERYCATNYGRRHPILSLTMVQDPEFQSPLEALLTQLEAEGHDVSAARIEFTVYKDRSSHLIEQMKAIKNQLLSLQWGYSERAFDHYLNPEFGGEPPAPTYQPPRHK